MTPEQLSDLRRKAEAAKANSIISERTERQIIEPFYAAANPAVVLDLLDEIDGAAKLVRGYITEHTALRSRLAKIEEAARPFTFAAHPDGFQCEDGGMTDCLVCDENVRALRSALTDNGIGEGK